MENTQNSKENDYRENSLKVCMGDCRTFSVNADASLIGLTSRITGAVLNG